MAGEFAGTAKVVKVDIEKAPGIAAGFRVQAVPTLLVFNRGRVVEQIVGAATKAALADALRQYVDPDPQQRP